MFPSLKKKRPNSEGLKKNTGLSGLQKVEQLKQITGSAEAKITPLLDPQQQQKFQAIREENRKKLAEELGSKAMQKAEGEIKKKM